MAENQAVPPGPDLTQGIPLSELPDGGKLVGRVGEEHVLLVRKGTKVFAIGAHCTHYNGPLVDDSSSTARFTAPGTTPVSTCGPAKPCAPPR